MGDAVRKVRVGVIVFDAEQRLLLCRQNNRSFWVLPGGTLEPGETVIACAIRELEEETALDITNVRLFGLADFFRGASADNTTVTDVIDITCTAELLSDPAALAMTHDENLNDVRFFTRDDFATIELMPPYLASLLREHWTNLPTSAFTYFI